MPRAPQLLIALLVAATLASTAAFPLEVRHQAAVSQRQRSRTPTLGASGFLPSLWNSLTRLWGEVGCSADPYGGNCTATPTAPPLPRVDAGSSVGLFGACTH